MEKNKEMDPTNLGLIQKLNSLRAHDLADEVKQRYEAGLEEYGQSISNAGLNKVELLQHAIEEVLDISIYLRAFAALLSEKEADQLAINYLIDSMDRKAIHLHNLKKQYEQED